MLQGPQPILSCPFVHFKVSCSQLHASLTRAKPMLLVASPVWWLQATNAQQPYIGEIVVVCELWLLQGNQGTLQTGGSAFLHCILTCHCNRCRHYPCHAGSPQLHHLMPRPHAAGNFCPNGWADCNGQQLLISQYDALYSLIGTAYG